MRDTIDPSHLKGSGMLTTNTIARLLHLKGRHVKRRVLICTFAAAALLSVIGYALSHEKATECGLVWMFEQCVGMVRKDVFGGEE